MNNEERDALCNFMINTLNQIFPNHNEYAFAILREIEAKEGRESEKYYKYPDYMLRAYWMKRSIETIRGQKVF